MKRIDYRQNKLIQAKATMKPLRKHKPPPTQEAEGPEPVSEKMGGGAVFGLVSDLLTASKIAQSAKHHHLGVHNFDRAKPLMEHAEQKPPVFVILDWDGCEAEAFQLLKDLGASASLKKIPTVGFVSQAKINLREEAQAAGCDRVYPKTEFLKSLDDLLVRYAR